MIDRSKLSPAGEKTMVETDAQLMELCKQPTASVQRMVKPSLRGPSGFVSMSRVAEEMRLTKALTPVFVDEAVTFKAIETWIRETWGDLKPDETAEKLGRGGL